MFGMKKKKYEDKIKDLEGEIKRLTFINEDLNRRVESNKTLFRCGNFFGAAGFIDEDKLIYFAMALVRLKDGYDFKNIVRFLKGDEKEGFYFKELKPLYDEYGYEFTNKWVLKIAEEASDNE